MPLLRASRLCSALARQARIRLSTRLPRPPSLLPTRIAQPRSLATLDSPRTPIAQLDRSPGITMQRHTQPFALGSLGPGWSEREEGSAGRRFAVYEPAIEVSPNDDRAYR